MIWNPHVTVAAIIERNEKYLLVEERIDGKIVLNQPAGHLDDQENLIDAVVREVLEETAWHFLPVNVINISLWRNPESNETFLRTGFCGSLLEFAPDRELDSDIIRTVWLTHKEIIANQERLRSPLVLESISDYLEGQRFPLSILKTVS
ncbi:MAG: NUDIX hydrolase [Methylococcales bacterium]